MKNLKNYIKKYLNESVWDIEDNVESNNEEFILNDIKKFIKDNYENINITRCKIVFDDKKDKYVVNYDLQVFLKQDAEQLTNGVFEWGTVEGFFNCDSCSKLTSLEGAPEVVKDNFYCARCPITSLKGAPKIVSGAFSCSRCPITTLEGAPEKVEGNFYCLMCPELKSLKGAPETVDKDFKCAICPELTSLEDAPKEVGGDFYCTECDNLKSLDGIGKVRGKIKQVKDRYDY